MKDIATTNKNQLDGKTSWIGSIGLKIVQNKALTPKEMSFMQSMMSTDNNRDYASFIKNMLLAVTAHPEFHDSDTVVDNFHKNLHLHINMYKAEKQGHRDDAATRKMNIDAINKYSKLAKSKGAEFHPEMFGVTSAKSYSDDNTIDVTKENDTNT